MLFREPEVNFIELLATDINTVTGPGYTICQRIATGNVTCKEWDPDTNITKAELCDEMWCDRSSDAANYIDANRF